MPTPTPLLTPFVDGWANYNRLIIDALRGLPEEAVASRTAPHQWAVWQLASHVAGVRAYWFGLIGVDTAALRDRFRATATTVPGLDLEDAGWEDDDTHPRTSDELVAALSDTWTMMAGQLEQWTPDDLAAEFERPYGRTRRFSRAWVVWHCLEHDLHHGGEISQILGASGYPAPDL